MRKAILLALLLMLSAPLALGQQTDPDEPKKAEYFIGFSYENSDSRLKGEDFVSIDGIPVTDGIATGPGFAFVASNNRGRVDRVGFNSAMTFFFTPRFGLTGDVSGHFRRENENFFGGVPFRAQLDRYYFLAGPQVRFVNDTRWTPFARGMAGVAYTRNRYGARSAAAPFTSFDDSKVDFALGLGGGVDYRISDRVSYRILQGDYTPVFRRNRTITASDGTFIEINGKTENNLRFSTGILLH